MSKRKTINWKKEFKENIIEPQIKKSKDEINFDEKEGKIRKKNLEFFVNTKDGNIKTNEDLANCEAHKFILLLQKVATFEELEENMDSEDGIKDIIGLIVTKIRDFIQNPGNGELSKPLKIAFGIFKACVHYCLSNFYFFTKWKPFKNYEKCFFPSFPHFLDSKGQMEVE